MCVCVRACVRACALAYSYMQYTLRHLAVLRIPVLRRRLRRSVANHMHAWHEFLELKLSKRHLHWRLSKLAARRRLARAVTTWQRRVRSQQKCGQTRIANLCEATLLHWQEQVSEEKHQREVLAKAVRRMRNRAAIMSLAAWREHTSNEARKRAVMGRVVTRIRNTTLSASLSRWTAHTAEQRMMAVKAYRVVARWRNQTIASSWDAWRTLAVEEARKRAVMKRIIVMMSNRLLVGAYTRWCEHTEELRTMAATTNKVLKRWRHRAAAAAVARWREQVSDRMLSRWQHGHVCRIGRRQLCRMLTEAWEDWFLFVLHCRQQQHQCSAQDKERLLQRQLQECQNEVDQLSARVREVQEQLYACAAERLSAQRLVTAQAVKNLEAEALLREKQAQLDDALGQVRDSKSMAQQMLQEVIRQPVLASALPSPRTPSSQAPIQPFWAHKSHESPCIAPPAHTDAAKFNTHPVATASPRTLAPEHWLGGVLQEVGIYRSGAHRVEKVLPARARESERARERSMSIAIRLYTSTSISTIRTHRQTDTHTHYNMHAHRRTRTRRCRAPSSPTPLTQLLHHRPQLWPSTLPALMYLCPCPTPPRLTRRIQRQRLLGLKHLRPRPV